MGKKFHRRMQIVDVFTAAHALIYRAENGAFSANWGNIPPLTVDFVLKFAEKERKALSKCRSYIPASYREVLESYIYDAGSTWHQFEAWQQAKHRHDNKLHYIIKRLYIKDAGGYRTHNRSDCYVKLRTKDEAHNFARGYSKQNCADSDRVGVFKLVGYYKAENPKPVEPVIVYCAVGQEE